MIQFECIDVSLEAILDVVNNITMRTQEILHIHLPNAMEFNLVLLMILQTSETLTLPQCSQICFACFRAFDDSFMICLLSAMMIYFESVFRFDIYPIPISHSHFLKAFWDYSHKKDKLSGSTPANNNKNSGSTSSCNYRLSGSYIFAQYVSKNLVGSPLVINMVVQR